MLGHTTRADVLAWAATHSLRCTTGQAGVRRGDIECRDVPGAKLPDPTTGVALSSLWLTFGTGDQLVAVVDVRHDADAASITDTFHATEHALTNEAGPDRQRRGLCHAVRARRAGSSANASVEYRFSDYYALRVRPTWARAATCSA